MPSLSGYPAVQRQDLSNFFFFFFLVSRSLLPFPKGLIGGFLAVAYRALIAGGGLHPCFAHYLRLPSLAGGTVDRERDCTPTSSSSLLSLLVSLLWPKLLSASQTIFIHIASHRVEFHRFAYLLCVLLSILPYPSTAHPIASHRAHIRTHKAHPLTSPQSTTRFFYILFFSSSSFLLYHPLFLVSLVARIWSPFLDPCPSLLPSLLSCSTLPQTSRSPLRTLTV